MKKTFTLALCLLALAACKTYVPDTPAEHPILLAPVMTRATETNFEAGDQIGVTITRTSGAYVTNEKLSFDGSVFSGSLTWYAPESETSTVAAYYPYNAQAGNSFSVQADQSAGTATSDYISGFKEGVTPSAQAVVLPFRHQLCRLVLKVVKAEGSVSSVSVTGVKLSALLGADFSASEDLNAAAGSVKAFRKDESTFHLIVPPQSVKAGVTVTTADGKELSQSLAEATLLSGKQFTINLVVGKSDLKVVLSSDIENWDDGGEIGGDGDGGDADFEEKLPEGYFTYAGERYSVRQMKDGKWWMTQNLRFVPKGFTVSQSLTEVTAGVFYPVVVNAEQTGLEFSTDKDVIAARGYLYQAEAALGLKIGEVKSLEDAQKLDGAQGLCPKGWHVPTKADIIGLVGKGVGVTTVTEAPYYNGADGSIKMLNEDGFQMEAYGAVTITDNTKTAGTFMGFMAAYKERVASGMFCGSTQSGNPTYNEKDVPESGLKNIQFFGFVPMTNKANEAEYTCNGGNVSYRIATPLRCVRDN